MEEPEDVMTTASTSGRTDTGQIAPDPLNAVLAENWWAVAIRGILGIAFGLIALLFPGATILSLVLVFAAYLLAGRHFRDHLGGTRRTPAWALGDGWRSRGSSTLSPAYSPSSGRVSPSSPSFWWWRRGRWSAAHWSLRPRSASTSNTAAGGWFWVAQLQSPFGVLLILAPLAGAIVLTWWLGAYALVFGVALLVLALKLRSRRVRDQ
jgi:uncharacterized membrane protein HdeD (DUF308 family)